MEAQTTGIRERDGGNQKDVSVNWWMFDVRLDAERLQRLQKPDDVHGHNVVHRTSGM